MKKATEPELHSRKSKAPGSEQDQYHFYDESAALVLRASQ